MPIVIPQGAFQQKPDIFSALGDAGTAGAQASGMMLEAALAKAKLDGWKEARELDRKRLEMEQQDRSAGMETANAIAQFRQQQVARDTSDDSGEIQQIQSIAGGLKDPRARQAFLEDVRFDQQQRAIQQGYGRVRDSLQDRILGMSRTPEAAGMVQDFELLAEELEQVGQQGVDPKLAAGIIDDVGRRFAEKSKVVYEHAKREREDQEALALLDEQMGAMPPGHPLRDRMMMLRLGVELGDLDGKDVVRSLRAQEMGLQEVQPGVFMSPEKFQQLQIQGQREQRLGTEGQARIDQGQQRIEQTKSRDELRAEHEKEMRSLRGREVAVKEQNAAKTKDGANVTRGMRAPTFGERMKMVDTLMEERDLEFGEAWAESGKMIQQHIREAIGELGAGAAVGKGEQPKGDTFLESLTPEQRTKFEALSPEAQAIVRKQRGG